ncbi:MAG: hypothetical protein ACR2OI_07670 [Acidimicrobiia bacterium]
MARNGMTLACAIRSHRLAENPELDDAHVLGCLHCQVEAVRYRTLLRRLRALKADQLTAPAGLAVVVRSGLSGEPSAPKKTASREAAVAAVGVVAVAGAVAFWRRSLSA